MKPWTFVHVADSQPGSPRSYRYNPAWAENWETAQKQIREIRPDLLLFGGDHTRDGDLHDYELEKAKGDLDAFPFPCHAVPGNMEAGNKPAPCRSARDDRDDLAISVTSQKIARYKRYFGDFPWSFVHKGVRFSGFYAALAGSGLPAEKEMWDWLGKLPDLPRADHHVIITHYPLFLDTPDDATFDLTVLEAYLPWYFSIDKPHRERMLDAYRAAGVTIAISSHIHCHKTDVFDGILFIKSPATCMSQMRDRWPDADTTLGFLRFDVTDAGITETLVPLEHVSTKPGYGPGGHPLPHLRDYSKAWEK